MSRYGRSPTPLLRPRPPCDLGVGLSLQVASNIVLAELIDSKAGRESPKAQVRAGDRVLEPRNRFRIIDLGSAFG